MEVRTGAEQRLNSFERSRTTAVVFIAALGFTTIFVRRQRVTYDGYIMAQVAASIANHGSALVHPRDGLGLNTPYSGYGIGTSLVMAVLYKIGDLTHANAFRTLQLTDAVMYAATITAIFVLLRRRKISPSIVIAVTLLFAFGTPLLAYAISDFSEPGTALMVALGLLALDDSRLHPDRAAIGIGAAIGGAALMRADSWLLIGPPLAIALCALNRDRVRRALLAAAAGALPFAIVSAVYNEARFGRPLASGYQTQRFSHPFWSGAYGLTLSPGRGVLIYVPLLLLAFAVLRYQTGDRRIFGLLAATMTVVRVLFYARWWSWYGGDSWGPRFMVPVLPAFAPSIADAIGRWRRNPIVYAPIVLSVAMSVVGLLVAIHAIPFAYGQAPSDVTLPAPTSKDPYARGRSLVRAWTSDTYVGETDRIMFDWSRFPAREP
jgi:hypothetical protein